MTRAQSMAAAVALVGAIVVTPFIIFSFYLPIVGTLTSLVFVQLFIYGGTLAAWAVAAYLLFRGGWRRRAVALALIVVPCVPWSLWLARHFEAKWQIEAWVAHIRTLDSAPIDLRGAPTLVEWGREEVCNDRCFRSLTDGGVGAIQFAYCAVEKRNAMPADCAPGSRRHVRFTLERSPCGPPYAFSTDHGGEYSSALTSLLGLCLVKSGEEPGWPDGLYVSHGLEIQDGFPRDSPRVRKLGDYLRAEISRLRIERRTGETMQFVRHYEKGRFPYPSLFPLVFSGLNSEHPAIEWEKGTSFYEYGNYSGSPPILSGVELTDIPLSLRADVLAAIERVTERYDEESLRHRLDALTILIGLREASRGDQARAAKAGVAKENLPPLAFNRPPTPLEANLAAKGIADPDVDVRKAAFRIVSRISATVDPLIPTILATVNDPVVGQPAAQLLAAASTEALLSHAAELRRAFVTADPKVRYVLALALGDAKSEVLEILLDMLESAELTERTVAAHAIGEIWLPFVRRDELRPRICGGVFDNLKRDTTGLTPLVELASRLNEESAALAILERRLDQEQSSAAPDADRVGELQRLTVRLARGLKRRTNLLTVDRCPSIPASG